MNTRLRPLGVCLLGVLITSALLSSPARARSAVPPTPERAWAAPHVANQLLVKLPRGGAGRVLPGGLVVLREIPELGLALVEAHSTTSLAEAAARLAEQTGVEWVEPNYTIHLDAAPNDPAYAARQLPYLSRIGAERAWDYTEGRAETIIAVLDTGVDMRHEDLDGAIWTNKAEATGRDLVDDDGNGFVDDVHGWDFASGDNDPGDDYGHGTHVAGIAAARIDNGKGIAGMAGRATIMPVDVFQGGIGTYEALIRAIIYATDNGARVINMSLGASSYSKGEAAAVDYAYNHGVVVVAAAGNSGREEFHYPAAHAHAIAVASTTADDFLSPFSTRGDWVDVAAPGSSIYSTFPGNGYGVLSGTSMATPHVSGLAGLILSRNLALSPDQVAAVIESTAEDLGSVGRDVYFGAGRIDAGRALAAVTPGDAPPPDYPPGASLDVDLPGCVELITNGSFEAGTEGWETKGALEVVTNQASAGAHSLHFVGGPSAAGTVTQTVALPPGTMAALLRFDYRIEPKDFGRGASPAWPFDDWFTVEWRTPAGNVVGQLLRTGNTADTVQAGLSWDHYLYRLQPTDLAALVEAGPLELVFQSQNDADAYATNIWLDALSVCAIGSANPARTYLSLIQP